MYQSTRMLPSEVFWGAIGNVLVRSSASSASTSSRSSVNGTVCCRLLVLVRAAPCRLAASISNGSRSRLFFSSLGFPEWIDFDFVGTIGVNISESDSDPSFSFNTALYVAGSSKSGSSSGYLRYLASVSHLMSCPTGASRIKSAIGNVRYAFESKLKRETQS